MAAGQQSAVRVNLIRGRSRISWAWVLHKKFVEWYYRGKEWRIGIIPSRRTTLGHLHKVCCCGWVWAIGNVYCWCRNCYGPSWKISRRRMQAGEFASCGPVGHGGAGIDRCGSRHAGRRPASTHPIDFCSESVKVGLVVVGFMVGKIYR